MSAALAEDLLAAAAAGEVTLFYRTGSSAVVSGGCPQTGLVVLASFDLISHVCQALDIFTD